MMRRIWTTRDLDAPAAVAWRILVDTDSWPAWGPSVRAVELAADRLGPGGEGTITTSVGLRVPFEITGFDAGRRWSWTVAGVPATDHTVKPLGDNRCRVGFGVPWPAAPYLAVCRVALGRIEELAIEAVAA